MARVLVIYAHPGQRHSVINTRLQETARLVDGITFHDLYAAYPQFKINIDAEQERLENHDAIVFQFPVYWYSTPSLLKEWQDLVLEYGFAYGEHGTALKDKIFATVVTAAGGEDAYKTGGSNNFTLRTLLSPLEQTANLCKMTYLPPFALYSAHKARNDGRAEQHAANYRLFLEGLRDDRLDIDAARRFEHLSDNELPLKAEV